MTTHIKLENISFLNRISRYITLYKLNIVMHYYKIPQYHFISLDVCCQRRAFIQHVTFTVLEVMTATYNIYPTHPQHYHMFDCCHLNVMLKHFPPPQKNIP